MRVQIREFQALIRKLYMAKDSKRGLDKTFIWFIEEVGELAELIRAESPDKEKLEEELADVFAWLVSIANLLGIDMEKAVRRKYVENVKL